MVRTLRLLLGFVAYLSAYGAPLESWLWRNPQPIGGFGRDVVTHEGWLLAV